MRRPNNLLCPRHDGVLTRYELTEVYLDYIEAYKHASKQSGNLSPTIMFVYVDRHGDGDSPRENLIFSPHHISEYSEDEVKKIVKETVMINGGYQYQLEMVVYTQINPSERGKVEQNIMFCARDVGGATLHTMYTLHKLNDTSTTMAYRNFGDAFNTWVPRDKKVPFVALKDNYLDSIAVMYALETSMGGL